MAEDPDLRYLVNYHAGFQRDAPAADRRATLKYLN
jgi:hypothetical protein